MTKKLDNSTTRQLVNFRKYTSALNPIMPAPTSFQTWQNRNSQTMERATRVILLSPRRHTDPAIVAAVTACTPPFTPTAAAAAAAVAQYGVPG